MLNFIGWVYTFPGVITKNVPLSVNKSTLTKIITKYFISLMTVTNCLSDCHLSCGQTSCVGYNIQLLFIIED